MAAKVKKKWFKLLLSKKIVYFRAQKGKKEGGDDEMIG